MEMEYPGYIMCPGKQVNMYKLNYKLKIKCWVLSSCIVILYVWDSTQEEIIIFLLYMYIFYCRFYCDVYTHEKCNCILNKRLFVVVNGCYFFILYKRTLGRFFGKKKKIITWATLNHYLIHLLTFFPA